MHDFGELGTVCSDFGIQNHSVSKSVEHELPNSQPSTQSFGSNRVLTNSNPLLNILLGGTPLSETIAK